MKKLVSLVLVLLLSIALEQIDRTLDGKNKTET